MDSKIDKGTRLLYIYDCLREGKNVKVNDFVRDFNISSRSVHRDINEIREYYADRMCWGGDYKSVVYDYNSKSYKLA